MKSLQNRTVWIVVALMSLMALTRFNHFGSSAMLPDASYAVFFLGGLFLGRLRNGFAMLTLLLVEAAMVDYFATTFLGVSAWCVTPAYGFLAFSYASLWYVARWYAPHHDLSAQGLLALFAAAIAASSLAFVIANVSFYMLAGYFGNMSASEYSTRVAAYYGSYIEVALLYIGFGVIAQMVYALVTGKRHDANAV